MKRKNLLTGIMVAGMMSFVGITNAQQVTTTNELTDYSVLHENTTPATYVDSVTVGGGALSDSIGDAGDLGGTALNMVMPYFVMPDPMLNGGYDLGAGAINDAKLTSSWAWTFNVAPTTAAFSQAIYGAPLSETTDTLNQIFVDCGTTVEAVQINVIETSNPTNCPGNSKYIKVEVLAVPTTDIQSADENYCESAGTSKSIVVNLTGVPPFTFRIDSSLQTVNPADGLYDIDAYNWESVTTGATNGSTVGGGTLAGAATAWTFTFDVKGMACNGGKITKRLYTVTGVNDRISRKSDRSTVTDLYYFANDPVTYVAYPTPATGNIYNIDN